MMMIPDGYQSAAPDVVPSAAAVAKMSTILGNARSLLFLAVLISTAAHAQAPAGPNRPIGIPEGYIITPFGYFHPSCVRQLADGDALLEDQPGIQHADGTIENLPACEHPHYAPGGEIAAGQPLGLAPIESAAATTTSSYGELAASWTVPPAPASNDGQTLYFFPGLEQNDDPSTTILQPVLGWNADFSGAWGIASWNCCPGGITTESTPVGVSSGDKINGSIQATCGAGTLSCPTWDVAIEDATLSKGTALRSTSSAGQTFNGAFAGVLEAAGLVQCTDYPANGQLTLGLELYDNTFVLIANPDWSATIDVSSLAPQCGYGVQVAAEQVTLDYAAFVTLFSFGYRDGDYPVAGLVQARNGYLYGTTANGGTNSVGTIFNITTSGVLTTLTSFCSYGEPCGAYPEARLVLARDGNLYGTTEDGGAGYAGTVFEITAGGAMTTLYAFCSQSKCTDGANPVAGLVQARNGNLYGTTSKGGANDDGTIFEISPGGALTTLYSFCSQSECTDGIGPVAGLVQAHNGNLYGTTPGGGAGHEGTIFAIAPSGVLTTLYSFCSQGQPCTDGAYSLAGLVQASDGNLYGTTQEGGVDNGSGTIFKITPSGALTTLYSFTCSTSGCPNGALPFAGLIQASDGNLYGTTLAGGAGAGGTVFKITLSGALTTVYSLCPGGYPCADGQGSVAALVQASDGNLYGTTSDGGGSYGTVFRLSLGLPPPSR